MKIFIMNTYRAYIPLFCILLCLAAAAGCAPTTVATPPFPQVTFTLIDQELPKRADVMTQAELQSELMSFADRYAVVLGQAGPLLPA